MNSCEDFLDRLSLPLFEVRSKFKGQQSCTAGLARRAGPGPPGLTGLAGPLL